MPEVISPVLRAVIVPAAGYSTLGVDGEGTLTCIDRGQSEADEIVLV
jgi:hypothetical protein